ncbi:MAG: bifunctional diguanylate cyclase/phosphodiesterase [Planctomycetota bacterium]
MTTTNVTEVGRRGLGRLWPWALFVATIGVVAGLSYAGSGGAGQRGPMADVQAWCGLGTASIGAPTVAAGAAVSADPFTNFGAYVPRIHCMQTAEGRPDWFWIGLFLLASLGVVAAYARIYLFWRKAYLAQEPRDRNPKLMDLARVFLWCAICGYVTSSVMFFWPGYRLALVCFVALNVFAWRFAYNLQPFAKVFEGQRFERLSERDDLTGLVNRGALVSQIEASFAERNHAVDRGEPAGLRAVLFMDLDGFKLINDCLGHASGDRLIQAVGERIDRAAADLAEKAPGLVCRGVGRLGGDEFAVFLSAFDEIGDPLTLANALHRSLDAPFDLDGRVVHVSTSVGVAIDRGDYQLAEDLLRDADIAMYQAKSAGRSGTRLFDSIMRVRVQESLDLQSALRQGIARNEIVPYLQPIVSMETGEPVGFEALARWDRPGHGWVSPGAFIPAAEDSGLVVPLGWSMLRQSCVALQAIRNELPDAGGLYVSVNLSRVQLVDADCADRIRAVLGETGLPPEALHIEITESAIMTDVEAGVARLRAIRELGVHISLDDFGTGYSSLSCLHKFPLDELKIDRSFIADATERQDFAAVVHAIVALASNLDIAVVAEGVETIGQVAQLQALGCGKGQGYFFARPMPVDAARKLLANGLPTLTGDARSAA